MGVPEESGGSGQTQSQPSADQLPSIDALTGDTVEIKFKLKYKKADVEKLVDKLNYKYIALSAVIFTEDGGGNFGIVVKPTDDLKVDHNSAYLPAKITQDDQEMTFYAGIPALGTSQLPLPAKCTLNYTYLGDYSEEKEWTGSQGRLATINIKRRPQPWDTPA
jgi:hypothetical protein